MMPTTTIAAAQPSRANRMRWIASAALLAALATTGLSHANNGAEPAQPNATQKQEKRQAHMAERQTQHLERMKAQLQLQPQQEAAWQAYVSAVTQTRPAPAPQPARDAKTLERLDWNSQQRQAHMAAAEQHDQATRKLYQSLTPAQQQAMDAMPQRAHHRAGMAHKRMHPGKGER